MTKDVEEPEVFFSGFTTKARSQASQVSEPSGRVEGTHLLTNLLAEHDPFNYNPLSPNSQLGFFSHQVVHPFRL